LEEFRFDAVAPEPVGGGFVGGPGFFVAVELGGAVAVEGEFLVEQFVDLADAGFAALDEAVVDVPSGLEVAEEDVVLQRSAVAGGELVDVLLGEEEAVVVERFEVGVEGAAGLGDAGGDLVVEAGAAEVRALQHAADGGGYFAEASLGFVLGRGGKRGGEQEARGKNEAGRADGHDRVILTARPDCRIAQGK
jgi:hypothetical protein